MTGSTSQLILILILALPLDLQSLVWAGLLVGFRIGPAVTALPIAATENIVFLLMIMIGIVKVKYSGLWRDLRAWDLAGKTSKNSL